MNPSIFRSSIKAFFVSFCAVIGVGLGIIPVVLFLAGMMSGVGETLEIKNSFTTTILPDANNHRKILSDTAPVILKINIFGVIGTEKLNMNTVRQQLIESREGILKNDRVKAILIHINSPGGTVSDANGIYLAIKEYKEIYKIPVYAYIDGLCASGGMYIAAAADQVYASDTSLVGSIGVITPSFFNFTKLMEKVGIDALTLFSGKGKDELNPFRPWKEGEENTMKSVIDYFYDHFVTVMTTNRPLINRTRLINEYGANIFPAEKGMEYGFIDGYGHSINDTLKGLAQHIGIEDEYYQVVKLDRKAWLSDLFTSGECVLSQGAVKHEIELMPELPSKIRSQFLYLYLPGH